mmetsp:Transcript_1691/g.2525  ORF Transcript_1691/g.2525 Transcript_1691/m.2525 type:complete len:96 (+) Transcript_1691:191-478(+)
MTEQKGFPRGERDFADELIAQRSVKGIFELIHQRQQQFNGVNLFTALHRLAKCQDAHTAAAIAFNRGTWQIANTENDHAVLEMPWPMNWVMRLID